MIEIIVFEIDHIFRRQKTVECYMVVNHCGPAATTDSGARSWYSLKLSLNRPANLTSAASYSSPRFFCSHAFFGCSTVVGTLFTLSLGMSSPNLSILIQSLSPKLAK